MPALLGGLSQKMLRESLRVERLKIVELLPDPEEADR
jgi:hypothetical protein